MMVLSHISLLVFGLLFASFARAFPTIEAVGSKFFKSDGTQYFIKGVAYQLIEDDPLVNVTQCRLDAALMKSLGANTIRVYHVDATADHTGCMNAFADAGIYLFVDLDSFQTYIAYDHVPSWTKEKSDSYRAVMDSFAPFENTAGFLVGNENLNGLVDAGIAPYLLAATVDLKGYRQARGYRNIPIGYSGTDTGALPMLQDYFVCRPNETERLEFYALNSYRWCGNSNYEAAYSNLQAAAEDYPVPIWFSEVGCNTVKPRTFTDQIAVFSDPMVGTWSGSMIYEWIQEVNDYGLVSYGPQLAQDVQIGKEVVQGFTRQGTPTPVQPDFDNLKSQWATLNPSGVRSADYVKAITSVSRTCPSSTADGWTVDPSSPLPTLGQAALVSVTPAPTTVRPYTTTDIGAGAGTTTTGTGRPGNAVSESPTATETPKNAAAKLMSRQISLNALEFDAVTSVFGSALILAALMFVM